MFKTLFAEETEETRRLLGSMATEPVKEAVDPAREADSAPPTVLHGTLTVEVPGGETMVLKTTFDGGSNTDAVSEKVAMQLKKLGVPWGEAGGGVSMAVSSSAAVPHGEQEHRRNFEALAVYSQRKTNQNRLELVLANGFADSKLRENRGNRPQSTGNLDARSRLGPFHVS